MVVNFPAELEECLLDLAARSGRSPEEIAREAIERFVAYRLELSELVKRGDADIAAGRLLESGEVLLRIESKYSTQ